MTAAPATAPPLALAAKFPFLPGTAELVGTRGPPLQDLLFDRAYARVRSRGLARVQGAVLDTVIPSEEATSESDALVEMLSYGVGRMLIAALDLPWAARRSAMAEAKLAHERLPGVIAPAYDGRSIGSILPTALGTLGAQVPHELLPALRDLPPELTEGVERIVLLTLDGWGWRQLHAHLAGGWAKLASCGELLPLTTVSPSTTTAAIASLNTGLAPAQLAQQRREDARAGRPDGVREDAGPRAQGTQHRAGDPDRDDRLDRNALAFARELVGGAPAASLAEAHGLRAARIRLLAAGAAIVETVLDRVGAESGRVADTGIREGAVIAADRAGDEWRERLDELAHGWIASP